MGIEQFLNIPYVPYAKGFEGCDCVGLVSMYYDEKGWLPTFNDGQPYGEGWWKDDPNRFKRYLEENFIRVDSVDELIEGDIVYFTLEGWEFIGIWYPTRKGNTVLTQRGRSRLLHYDVIRNSFICGYKKQ